MTRVIGYLMRIAVRVRYSYNTLCWINRLSTTPGRQMTDYGLMMHADMMIREPLWAIFHFPSSNSEAESWIKVQ